MNTKLSLPFDLKFEIVHRIECSGESRYMNQLADIAATFGAVLHAWESGQFGIAHPQYRVPAIRSNEFLAALEEAQFSHSFVTTINP